MRISELTNSIFRYKNDIIVLKNRIKEFEGLKNKILSKIKRISYHFKIVKKKSYM